MPRRCCVPNCSSNYDTSIANDGFVSAFSFPKPESPMFNLWMKSIPRENWQPTKHSQVCLKHFRETDIVRANEVGRPLKRIRLAEGAVPSLFPNCPSYLSKSEPSCSRRDPNVRREKALAHCEEINNEFLSQDRIGNFENFRENFKSDLNLNDWFFKINADSIIFFLVEEDPIGICEFVVRISVSEDLFVRIFIKGSELSDEDLKWVLPKSKKLTLWSQLVNILSRYKHCRETSQPSREIYLRAALRDLEAAFEIDDEYEHAGKLEILINQLKHFFTKQTRYDSSIIIMSIWQHRSRSEARGSSAFVSKSDF